MKTFEAVGHTHVGMKRKQNQDSFQIHPETALYIVADGMGGHLGGEIASQMAVERISHFFSTHASLSCPERLWQAFYDANQSIQKKVVEDPKLMGMGTTAVCLHITSKEGKNPGQAYIAHVGDSRCYLIRNKKIWQLTQDHSHVQEKLKAGLIKREQLKTDRMRNVITRSVGFEKDLNVDIYTLSVSAGDLFLLCSDGLSNYAREDDVLNIIFSTPNLQSAIHRLVDFANEHGGEDNVTAVLVKA